MQALKRAYRLKVVVAILVIAAVITLAATFLGRVMAPRPVHIGFLGMDSVMQAKRFDAFRDGLRARGYVEGSNVIIDSRWAEGRFERLPQLAAELVAENVSVIVTAAPPAVRAAKQATSTIPIVMSIHNPLGSGFAASLSRPGGNITGIAFQDAELSTKRLEYLRAAVPGLRRLAILWNKEGGGTDTVVTVESAAIAVGLETRLFEVSGVGDFATAVAGAKAWGAQGLIQLASPFITLNRKLLLAELSANRMPATCELREYVVDGCLMSYSADLNGIFRQLAQFVDRVLRGENPADIAIEQPREFQLVINKKTADALGLAIEKALEIQMTEPFL
jgi:putative ABC transport system substrate-binding protein